MTAMGRAPTHSVWVEVDIKRAIATGYRMDASRLRRAILPASLLLLLFLFVWSYVPKPITDLRSADVTRVPASALPFDDYLRETLTKRGEAVWKVSLRGDAGWIREVNQHNLNSYAIVVRCDDRDRGVLGLGPYVGQVPVTYKGEGLREYRPPAKIVQYDVYLPETGRYLSQADVNAPMASYDLGSQRLMLCLKIAGGAMHGAYNQSNEVRLMVGGTH